MSDTRGRPIVYDITRLITRVSRPVPNGIDRVDIGYAKYFFCNRNDLDVRAALLGPIGVRIAGKTAGCAVAEAISAHWREGSDPSSDQEFEQLRAVLQRKATGRQGEVTVPRGEQADSQPTRAALVARNRSGAMPYVSNLLARNVVFGANQLFPGREPVRAIPENAVYLNTTQFPLWIDWYFRWLDRRHDIKPVFFIHDLLPIQYPEFFPRAEAERHAQRMEVLGRRAAGVIVASEATKAALIEHFRSRGWTVPPLAVIPIPVSSVFESAAQAGDWSPTVPYFITLGTLEPRKNHLTLLHIWRDMAAELGEATPKLLIVGVDGWHNENVADLLDRCDVIRPHIIRARSLSTPALRTAMAHTRAVLMPSFAEGFGLPVAEAVASGVPVIASEIAPFGEYNQRGVTLVDPLDGPGWKAAIEAKSIVKKGGSELTFPVARFTEEPLPGGRGLRNSSFDNAPTKHPTAAHERALEGFLTRNEKQLLTSIANRLPRRVVPDHLTLMGLFGSFVVFAALIASNLNAAFLWLAVAGLLINWFGDSLDGTLARVRRIERPRYGFYVDHVSDLLSQFLIVLGLGLSPFMRFDVALLALVGYLALSVFTFVKLHISRTMQISYFGFGPTEVRILIGAGLTLAATTALPTYEFYMVGTLGIFDIVGSMLFVFACTTVAIMFADDVRKLAIVDPPRHDMPEELQMRQVGLEDQAPEPQQKVLR